MRKIIVSLSIFFILICCAFSVSADNGPTIAVIGNKVFVSDSNVNNKNHSLTVFYLSNHTVDDPTNWGSLVAIDNKYTTISGLSAFNGFELTRMGNYVLRLVYYDEGNNRQIITRTCSIGSNNYFDFDDYATYKFFSDNTVRATVSLPFEYYTCVDNNLGELLYLQGKSFSFYTSDWFLFSTNPFFEYYYNYDINNPEPPSTFVNGNFFDLDVLPKDFVLTNSFRIDFSGENYHWFESGQAYFVFVDSQGNYLGHKTVLAELDEHGTYSYCTFTYDTKLDSYAIPANAKGLFVCYALSGNLNTGTTGNMTITYSSMTFDFDLDDAFVNWKNEEIVHEKLDSLINGTPEQNQQAQDAVGGLNSSTDKLGQLGDTMSSVDKPSIDSNKISADSLVPHTSLVALSSPFQALWENNQLLAMLTIVVTLVLVSWVFFGKKG